MPNQKQNAVKYIVPALIGIGIAALFKKYLRMGTQLTKNFNLDEFQSKDGAPMPKDVEKNIRELAKNLQVIRNYFNLPLSISSGYRSPAHNSKIGGAKDSQHKYGRAADFSISGKSPIEVAKVIEDLIAAGKIKQGGLGIYPTWVHYDIRGTKARW